VFRAWSTLFVYRYERLSFTDQHESRDGPAKTQKQNPHTAAV